MYADAQAISYDGRSIRLDRLVADLAGKVRAGRTVEVVMWIHQTGKRKPVLKIPQQNPNTVPIPALFAALGH